MKFSILALGAAVAGISSQCAAQLHIEPSFPTRAPEARLVSQQDLVGSSIADEPVSTQENSSYFAPTPPQAEITRDQVRRSQSILGNSSSEMIAKETPAAPGKTVTKNVMPGAPLEVLAGTPEVGMVPVCWQNAGCKTPNPIADYMMDSWCTNGLWDNYACQRARQCAHIQQQLFGHNRYTCQGCASCGPVVAPACASCASPAPSQCAQNIAVYPQPLMANAPAPAPQSPLLGELQSGLPVVNFDQVPFGTVPPGGYGQQAAQFTNTPVTNRLPNGQPLLQLPEDVPSVPSNAVGPGVVPPTTGVMPALPVPTASPVVASRPSASLR
jgi:hypothetical protein